MFFKITIIFFTLGGTLNTSNYCLLMKDGLSGSVHFVQPFPDEDPIPFKSHEHSMFSSIIFNVYPFSIHVPGFFPANQVLVRLSLYQLQHSQRAAWQSPLAARAAAAVCGSWRPGPWRRLRRSPRYPRCWDRGSQRQSRQSNDLVPLRCQVLMFPEVGVFGNLMINSSILK